MRKMSSREKEPGGAGRKARQDLAIVSFRIPKRMLEKVDSLVAGGYYVDRSEVIRHALLILLDRYGLSAGAEGE